MKNLSSFLIGTTIVFLIIFTCIILADLSSAYISRDNLIQLNFKQKIDPNVKMKYDLLYNSCTKEYEVKVDDDGYIGVFRGFLHFDIICVQLNYRAKATRFKDSIEAKYYTYLYFKKIYDKDYIDPCKDSFKTLTK